MIMKNEEGGASEIFENIPAGSFSSHDSECKDAINNIDDMSSEESELVTD
jgi:hypothetical protein